MVKMGGRSLPAVTADEMREIDRVMVGEFKIGIARMMENAGRNLAEVVRVESGDSVRGKNILVLAGNGNNGGGGLAAARYLSNWGARVSVHQIGRPKTTAGREQAGILNALPEGVVKFVSAPGGGPVAAVVDALIGYGLDGEPRGAVAQAIGWANERTGLKVALDVPSGLDSDTGAYGAVCFRADATVTLALPKIGVVEGGVGGVVGRLYLGDIGVPPALYRRFGWEVGPIFERAPVVRLF